MDEIKSERLLLKKIGENDHYHLYTLWHDKDLIKYTYHQYMDTPEEAKKKVLKIIAHYAKSGGHFGPYLVYYDGLFAGYCGLDYKSEELKEYKIFYIVSRAQQGKGIGTKVSKILIDFAFRKLGGERVAAEAVADNHASCRILEKSGMMKEGCLRRKFHKGDGFHDLMVYAILRGEWVGT